jgi:hypothetical protein
VSFFNSFQTICFVLIFSLYGLTSSNAQSCGYGYSKTLTIDKDKVSGTNPLQQFPALLDIVDNDLRTVANGGRVENANGFDIVFVDAGSGERLAHEIEAYDDATGAITAWIRIPTVYTDFDTEIRMIYGNAQITSDPSTDVTWDENYQAVWHLNDDFLDATSLGNDGTNNGSADAGGKIADGQDFDGATDYITRADADLNGNIPAKSTGSPNAFTLSGWINVDNLSNRQPLLSKQGDGVGNDRGFVFMMEDNNEAKIELFKNNDSGTRTEVFSNTSLTTNSWFYLVATYQFVTDGTSICNVYLNGIEEGSTNTALGPIFTNTRDLEIGRYFFNGSANFWMDGSIDEVRISDVVRSAGWIATEYENQNDPANFFAIGPEVVGDDAPLLPVCASGFKKTITIDADEVAGTNNLTDFPVLIDLTDNDLRTVANGGNVENLNGWDMVFTDTNLVPLDHDLERYDPVTGDLTAWVKIPVLPHDQDYVVYMMYGNPDVFSDPSTPCTWTDFDAVWHLHDDFLDATANDEDGTNNGSTDNTTSQIADGQSFDGNDFIGLSSFPNKTTDFTITGWIRTTDNTEQGQRIFCDDESNSGGYALSLGDGGNGRIRFYSRNMNTVILDGATNAISNNTWYYVAGVVDQGNQDRFIYIDGIQDAADLTDGGTWGADAGEASIGGETNGGETGNRFEGSLDEIRIANIVRSADWLRTEYNNQSNPSGFYTVGSEDVLSATTTQDGNWNQTTTWSAGSIPTDGSSITIRHEVDLTDRDITLCNLTIESAADVASFEVGNGFTATVSEDMILDGNGANSLTISTNNGNSSLEVSGDLIIQQASGSGILLVEAANAGDSLLIDGNLIANHDGGGLLELRTNNATAGILVEGNASFNMNDDGNGDDLELDLNAGTFQVNGFLAITRNNGFNDVTIDMNGGNLIADSLYLATFNGGGTDQSRIIIDGNSSVTITNGVYVDMNGGDDYELFLNTNNGTSASLDVGGDFFIDKQGGDDVNITINGSASNVVIGRDFKIRSSGAEQVTWTMNNGTMTVTDSLVLEQLDGGLLFLTSLNNNSTLTTGPSTLILDNNANQELLFDIDNAAAWTVNGNLQLVLNNGNDLELHLGENSLNATASITVTGDLLLDHNPSAGGDDIQLIVSDDASATVQGNLTMDTDGASGPGNFYTRLNNNGLLDVDGNITFTGANGSGEIEIEMNGASAIALGGNILRDAAPNHYGLLESNGADVSITLDGTSDQILADDDGAGTDGIQYQNLTINNTSAVAPQITMEGTVRIPGNVSFTDGVLETTMANLLIIEDNATTNGGNANSYVSGPVQKEGDDAFVFPLGKDGIWARLELSGITGANTTDAFTAEYFRSAFSESFYNPSQYAGNTGGLFNTSTKEYWDLNRDNGTAQPVVTLYWENNDSSLITDTADLVVAHYASANTWVNEGGTPNGLLSNGQVSTSGTIATFSPFTFGSEDPNANPLPVELLSFIAEHSGDAVELTWQTASERNNEGFFVERSLNGEHFEYIGFVSGHGTVNEASDYRFLDEAPFLGRSFYRLKQVDFDGQYEHSPSRMVTWDVDGPTEPMLYPNPATDLINSTVPLHGTLYDALGRPVLDLNGRQSFSVEGFTPGVYIYLDEQHKPYKLVVE